MEESILSIPFVMGGTKILPSSLHRKWREPKLQQSTTKSSLKLCSCLVSSVIWPCISTRNFLPCMQSQLHTYASDIGNAWLNRRAELFCSQVRVSGNPGHTHGCRRRARQCRLNTRRLAAPTRPTERASIHSLLRYDESFAPIPTASEENGRSLNAYNNLDFLASFSATPFHSVCLSPLLIWKGLETFSLQGPPWILFVLDFSFCF